MLVYDIFIELLAGYHGSLQLRMLAALYVLMSHAAPTVVGFPHTITPRYAQKPYTQYSLFV
jgi:hypothetical protein